MNQEGLTMMQLKVLASMSILGGLIGCSTTQPATLAVAAAALNRPTLPVQVAPAPTAIGPLSSPEDLYDAGRIAYGSGQLARAIRLFERVLALAPDHAGALNALGIVLAQQGQTDDALDLLARASELNPGAAYIHNNMGYALLKADRLDEAQVALKLARDLEPKSVKMLENMALLTKAQALREARLGVDTAPVVEAPGIVEGPQLLAVAPNVFELRTMGPQAIEAIAAAAASGPLEIATLIASDHLEPGYKLELSHSLTMQSEPFAIWTDIRGVRLEVSNGVGISRLARRTADRLAGAGVATARLTNAKNFQRERTQVQYLAGQEGAMRALMANLPLMVDAVQVDHLDARIHVRLVLGHDVAGRALAAWSHSGDTQLAHAKPALVGGRTG
jgi:hypothetical protein